MINFDDIKDIKKALSKERNNLLRLQLKIIRLEQVIDAHERGIYNPKLYEELMKRSREV